MRATFVKEQQQVTAAAASAAGQTTMYGIEPEEARHGPAAARSPRHFPLAHCRCCPACAQRQHLPCARLLSVARHRRHHDQSCDWSGAPPPAPPAPRNPAIISQRSAAYTLRQTDALCSTTQEMRNPIHHIIPLGTPPTHPTPISNLQKLFRPRCTRKTPLRPIL